MYSIKVNSSPTHNSVTANLVHWPGECYSRQSVRQSPTHCTAGLFYLCAQSRNWYLCHLWSPHCLLTPSGSWDSSELASNWGVNNKILLLFKTVVIMDNSILSSIPSIPGFSSPSQAHKHEFGTWAWLWSLVETLKVTNGHLLSLRDNFFRWCT